MKSFCYILSILVYSSCVQLKTQSRLASYLESPAGEYLPTHSSASNDVQLKLLENKIQGRHELLQYSKALPYFYNSNEQIEFLRLDSFKSRQEWLNKNKFWNRISSKEKTFDETIKNQDISLGMTEEMVKKSWGEPQSLFISGLPEFKNSRLIYIKSLSTPEGFKEQKRIVYIESGLVVGWETQ